jgi:hypothetical protein
VGRQHLAFMDVAERPIVHLCLTQVVE